MSDPIILSNITWPKILPSSITGVLSEEEKRTNNTMLWNSAIQYLIDWYLNYQQAEKQRLNPKFAKISHAHSPHDLAQVWEDVQHPRAESLNLLYKEHERLFAAQLAICAERSIAHVALLSASFEEVHEIFKSKDLKLTPEVESIVWSGISNTGRYHHFPVSHMGFDYEEPELPEDLMPEMHDTARQYHKNITGAFAAAVCANRMRPHPECNEISEEEILIEELRGLASRLVLNMLQAEMESQRKMIKLLATVNTADVRNTAMIGKLNNTWAAKNDVFSSPLVGVSPVATHNFVPFRGDPSYSERSMSESDWKYLLANKTNQSFPVDQNKQAVFVMERLGLKPRPPVDINPILRRS